MYVTFDNCFSTAEIVLVMRVSIGVRSYVALKYFVKMTSMFIKKSLTS